MKYETKKMTVKELTSGYKNNEELGAVTMDGKLNIRPAYQREFIYQDKQRDAVIETLDEDMPIGVLHLAKIGEDTYEMLDGQQRTISIAEYVSNNFSTSGYNRGEPQYFDGLSEEKQLKFNEYEILINIYEGTPDEKLKWFRKINIAGEKLTNQELRNIVYTGLWLTDAKKHFSKKECVAHSIGSKYLNGSAIRQEYLETALKWISNRDGITIEKYMANSKGKDDAHELWAYFRAVIEWVKRIFPDYRKEMKGLNWGSLYDAYKDVKLDKDILRKKVKELMIDDDITKKSGIYTFILGGDERKLSIRAFTEKNKREVFEKQNGICIKCTKQFAIEGMQADHITPWSKGGKTLVNNCQMLCAKCNAIKSNN